MAFPTALDSGATLPSPAASDKTNSPSHSALHGNVNTAVIAVETKLGTGASTPVANTFLFGTGAGTSAWTVATSAQIAAAVSDETGTGALVFANTPTLITPKVDTVQESTPSNGVTVGGVNLKSGVINTASAVTTASIAAAAVTASKLATGATAALIATSENTASTSYVDLATVGPSVTVTIGSNGLALVTVGCIASNNTIQKALFMGFVVSGANTLAASNPNALYQQTTIAGGSFSGSKVILLSGLNAGSTTFKAQYAVEAGTGTFSSRQIAVVPL